MRTTAETHTSLLSLVPINTLFIIRGFGSDKYSDASMYVCVCLCLCVCVCACVRVYDGTERLRRNKRRNGTSSEI